jgi:hypothetical protein
MMCWTDVRSSHGALHVWLWSGAERTFVVASKRREHHLLNLAQEYKKFVRMGLDSEQGDCLTKVLALSSLRSASFAMEQ